MGLAGEHLRHRIPSWRAVTILRKRFRPSVAPPRNGGRTRGPAPGFGNLLHRGLPF